MLNEYLPPALREKVELLPFSIPLGSSTAAHRGARYARLDGRSPNSRAHRRQISISTFSTKSACLAGATCLLVLATVLLAVSRYLLPTLRSGQTTTDDGAPIPLGQSIWPGGREVFWWERFPKFAGYYRGWKDIVPMTEYVPEQKSMGVRIPAHTDPSHHARPVAINVPAAAGLLQCRFTYGRLNSYHGLPQSMPQALLGSMEELGIDHSRCYDRINRFSPYGLGFPKEESNLNIELRGDNEGVQKINFKSHKNVSWNDVQEDCISMNRKTLSTLPRTAFVLRTYHDFDYTPHQILTLRAIMNELSLRTSGQITVHFLIHVRDPSIPIFASETIYNQTLASSLPAEFAGMGTLWTVPQMRSVYPGPFEETINFSGSDLYEAYRSLHFPLQYWAIRHPEFDYVWQWEMDIRVTGHYGELVDKITAWADRQPDEYLWERNSQFFIPSLHQNSYRSFTDATAARAASEGLEPIPGPQLNASELLAVPSQPPATAAADVVTDLITLNPIFDPNNTRWAFHDDVTGYGPFRPPTRAALITASRFSRRLLWLMHEETYRKRHTMFPEMYPASIAYQYGLRAVYAPITIYFDRDWDPVHADEVFNNAPISEASKAQGMQEHGGGRFHGENGSIFGPGEHPFRSSTWYSNAAFAGYLWRRWLGDENGNGEVDWELGDGNGRMCLPMMVLHPVKSDV